MGALIERLIGAFLAGDARVDPAPGACDYCHLTALCRIGAQRQSAELPAAEDADEWTRERCDDAAAALPASDPASVLLGGAGRLGQDRGADPALS